MSDLESKLQQGKRLLDMGLIDKVEYDAMKTEMLKTMGLSTGGASPDPLAGATRIDVSSRDIDTLAGITRIESLSTSMHDDPLAGETRISNGLTTEALERSSVLFSVGSSIGQYKILGEIGKGGMGSVYRARHIDEEFAKHTGDVAIKVMNLELSKDSTFRTRFMAEAGLGRSIRHPNFVAIHDVLVQENSVALVMDLVEGKSLSNVIHKKAMDLNDALPIIEALCTALDYLHGKGIVHRDLKPDNIIITPSGVPVILDMGIAKNTNQTDSSQTSTGLAMGTPLYMAPEQLDAKTVTGSADRYALGLIIYEMLVGRLPWEKDLGQGSILAKKFSENLDNLPNHPVHIQSAVKGLLRTDVNDRFASCAEFLVHFKTKTANNVDITTNIQESNTIESTPEYKQSLDMEQKHRSQSPPALEKKSTNQVSVQLSKKSTNPLDMQKSPSSESSTDRTKPILFEKANEQSQDNLQDSATAKQSDSNQRTNTDKSSNTGIILMCVIAVIVLGIFMNKKDDEPTITETQSPMNAEKVEHNQDTMTQPVATVASTQQNIANSNASLTDNSTIPMQGLTLQEKEANVLAVVDAWNNSLQTHNLSRYATLLTDVVWYYTMPLPKDTCLSKKQSSLQKDPQYTQNITNIKLHQKENDLFEVTFLKESRYKGKDSAVNAFLWVKRFEDGWKIVRESDETSKSKLNVSKKDLQGVGELVVTIQDYDRTGYPDLTAVYEIRNNSSSDTAFQWWIFTDNDVYMEQQTVPNISIIPMTHLQSSNSGIPFLVLQSPYEGRCYEGVLWAYKSDSPNPSQRKILHKTQLCGYNLEENYVLHNDQIYYSPNAETKEQIPW